jgi:hypothetical protein
MSFDFIQLIFMELLIIFKLEYDFLSFILFQLKFINILRLFFCFLAFLAHNFAKDQSILTLEIEYRCLFAYYLKRAIYFYLKTKLIHLKDS